MSITVKYFASLAEELGRREQQVTHRPGMDLEALWRQATGRELMPANVLVAVNQEYVERGVQVAEGDEVAFFPPVTGG